jgi:hypothetical protein
VAGRQILFAVQVDDRAWLGDSGRNLDAVVLNSAGDPILHLLSNIDGQILLAGVDGHVDGERREKRRARQESDCRF